VSDLPTGTVTFLFTDLEASTRLWEDHPDAMHGALARHDEILRTAVATHDGHLVKTTGDGIHAAFADASCAARAAVAAQLALVREPWGETGELRARMGIHTGPAQQRDGDYYGTALNRAARLMSVAHGGQIVVSLATEELLSGALDADTSLVDLGVHQLRDLAAPVQVFQLAHADLRREFPPLRSLDAYRGNLPVQATSFVGREEEIAAIGAALSASALVTITGVGGVGKTRLAVQVAADVLPDFADGAWICELAAAIDRESMLQIVAAALGVPPRAGHDLTDAIAEFLRSKRLLLVLDNCEHLLDAAGALAVALIQRCSGVRMLATSREGLGVDGEQVWPLRSLVLATSSDAGALVANDAVRLFGDRAHAIKPAFTLDTGNAVAVGEICRRLDGIPLAIELAAARVVSMTPREVADRLDERFRLLTGGRRTSVERQQTLRATVDWSYSLLDERSRAVFDRLAVFDGGFESAAAIAVATGDGVEDWDVLDALADLVAKSLVQSDETAEDTTRYDMLETLRHYARERLEQTSDADAWRRRHAEHYAAFAEAAGTGVRGPDELVWRARLRDELDNLRSAVAWSLDSAATDDAELGLRIITALTPQQSFDPALGIGAWATQAIDRAETSTPGRRYAVLTAAAYYAAVNGQYDRARALVAAATVDGVPDDAPWPAFAMTTLNFVEVNLAHHTRALEICEDALDRYGDRIDLTEAMTLHATAAGTANWTGNRDVARRHAELALDAGRASGSPSGIASSQFAYGVVLRHEDPLAARRAFEECIALVRSGASPVVYGYALSAVASVYVEAGEQREALLALRDALTYAIDAWNEPLMEQIRGEAVPVILELAGADAAAAVFPDTWRVPNADDDVSDLRTAGGSWYAMVEALRKALGTEEFDRAVERSTALSPRERAERLMQELDGLLATLDAEAGHG
jgi:predicted ATPase/class 3 adenylate cyclase